MKKMMTLFALVGALSIPMLAGTGSVQTESVETASAVPGAELPCPWCCPPSICGMNGPSFDGTTIPAERAAP